MYSAGKLILLPLLWISTTSMAQNGIPLVPDPGCEFDPSSLDGPRCRLANSPSLVIHREIQLPTPSASPKIEPRDCKVEMAIHYEQRNSIAKVAGSIENESCAASGGSLVIAITTKDNNDELKTQEYPQIWKRAEGEAVTFSADYQIGSDVSLVRARALKVTCKCDSAK